MKPSRTQYIAIAAVGGFIALGMSAAMLIAGITHKSVFEVLLGARGSAGVGTAAEDADRLASVVDPGSLHADFDTPFTLLPVTAFVPGTSTAVFDDGLRMSLLTISADGSANLEVIYPLGDVAGSTKDAKLTLSKAAPHAVLGDFDFTLVGADIHSASLKVLKDLNK